MVEAPASAAKTGEASIAAAAGSARHRPFIRGVIVEEFLFICPPPKRHGGPVDGRGDVGSQATTQTWKGNYPRPVGRGTAYRGRQARGIPGEEPDVLGGRHFP